MSDYMKCFWWENCACDGYENCTEECKSCLYIYDDDYDKYYLEYEKDTQAALALVSEKWKLKKQLWDIEHEV